MFSVNPLTFTLFANQITTDEISKPMKIVYKQLYYNTGWYMNIVFPLSKVTIYIFEAI